MHYMSSGHSHGEQITILLDGIPSNLVIDVDRVNNELARRQSGYGRGGRMKIEQDRVEIIGGVLFGKTTGAPLSIIIKNKDYQNHQKVMDPFDYQLEEYQPVKVPRPGHADLVGAMKYHQRDMKPVFERASARETVSRVAVGAICMQILEQLDIKITSFVRNIGGIHIHNDELDINYVDESPVRMPHREKTKLAMYKIDEVRRAKNTCGGIIHVEAHHVPLGLGSYVTSDAKLDSKIAQQFLSIQACKGISFGDGFSLANLLGSEAHDEIRYTNGFTRTSNHYGGFEGGMTNGMPIVLEAVFKPIPTLMRPLSSVHIDSKEVTPSHIERSDVCVIPAASVIGEHTLAYCLTKEICETFTSNAMEQLVQAFNDYRSYLEEY